MSQPAIMENLNCNKKPRHDKESPDGFEWDEEDGLWVREEYQNDTLVKIDKTGRHIKYLTPSGSWVQKISLLHPQVKVVDPTWGMLVVDEEMAPILSKLWKKGFVTFNSCQCNNGTIWIEFELDSFKKFLKIAKTCLHYDLWEELVYNSDTRFLCDDEDEGLTFSVSLRMDTSLMKELIEIVDTVCNNM